MFARFSATHPEIELKIVVSNADVSIERLLIDARQPYFED